MTTPKMHPHPHPPEDPCPGGCDDMLSVNARLDDGDERMTRIEELIKTNTKDTAEVLEILRMGRAFFKLIGYVGTAVKWVAPVVASCLTLYYLWRNGGKS